MELALLGIGAEAVVLRPPLTSVLVRFCSSKEELERPREAGAAAWDVARCGRADLPHAMAQQVVLGVAHRPCRVCGSSRNTLACLRARETYCLAVLIAMMDLPFSLHSGRRRELYGALQCTGRRNRVGEPLLGVQEDSLGCLVVLKSQF